MAGRINTVAKADRAGKWYGVRTELVISLCLALSVVWTYRHVTSFEFISLDDPMYVTENSAVKKGLSPKSIIWAFSATRAANWHPLTWLSHMLDYQLYGPNAGMHHATSLIIHTLNCLLLFFALRIMTGGLWKSAIVAALFGLHPINVDSVAWVAERKNVLSAFFWMLGMLTYAYYVKRPRLGAYLTVVLVFILGLAAKPIIVTLPFVFLLLDYWPLRRVPNASPVHRRRIIDLLLEKIPLIALSGASVAVSGLIVGQQGIVISESLRPMSLRIANALISYASYMGKMALPKSLCIFYPYPETVPFWKAAAAGVLIVIISAYAFRWLRSKPYIAVGWLWFLGTLVPFLGLVQAGLWPAMADRWAYVSFIGLFISVTWGVADLISRIRLDKRAAYVLTAASFFVLTTVTALQVQHWQDSIILFTHAIENTTDNHIMHNDLANALLNKNRITEAMTHFAEALRIRPNYGEAHNNLGLALEQQGRTDDALSHYFKAVGLNPHNSIALNNLGNALARQGRFDEAIFHYGRALQRESEDPRIHFNLGNALSTIGKLDEAVYHYKEALMLSDDDNQIHTNMGNALARQGKIAEAIIHYRKALNIKPDDSAARHNLEILAKAFR